MRANYKMQRLFVPDAIAAGATIETSGEQSHYLANVLRMVLTGSGECAKVEQVLGLPMPAWTLLWFVLLAILALVATARRRNS